MRKHDLAVIGIGAIALAVTAMAAPTVAQDEGMEEPAPVATDAPTLTPEQQSQYDTWPPDRQATYDGWGEEAQAYYWSLNPERQDFFWMLSDDDRSTLLAMEPVDREQAWQQVEGRSSPPSEAMPPAGDEMESEGPDG